MPAPAPTRRSVLAAGVSACAACLLAGCGGSTAGGRAGDDATIPTLATGPVDVGPAADFAAERIYDRWADKGFFVVRRGRRVFAVSSVCTHKHVLLDASGSDFGCPRHGSVFTPEGDVVKAPAQFPLPRHAIRLTPEGRIVVDPTVRFDKGRWADPAAVVML
ncbi:MAG TPA: Rieske 2Fe-2S domain-containing protein [Humisphaera sp.]